MSKIDEMIAEDRIREEVIARIEALQAYVIKVTDENKRLRAAGAGKRRRRFLSGRPAAGNTAERQRSGVRAVFRPA